MIVDTIISIVKDLGNDAKNIIGITANKNYNYVVNINWAIIKAWTENIADIKVVLKRATYPSL